MKKHGCLFWIVVPIVLLPLLILSAGTAIIVAGGGLTLLIAVVCIKEFSSFKNENKKSVTNIVMEQVDCMEGHEFERYCAKLLAQNDFTQIQVTPGSGDQGIDILAWKDQVKYGFQCKCYSNAVGNRAVQEAYSGKNFYNCDIGVVITNRSYTISAKELAKKNGIWLWDRTKIIELMKVANCREENTAISTQSDESKLHKKEWDNKQQFEEYCVELLSEREFLWIFPPSERKTNKINLVATRGLLNYAVRCEYCSCEVPEQVISETVQGRTECQCDCGIVIANNSFTTAAQELAKKERILLWDGQSFT